MLYRICPFFRWKKPKTTLLSISIRVELPRELMRPPKNTWSWIIAVLKLPGPSLLTDTFIAKENNCPKPWFRATSQVNFENSIFSIFQNIVKSPFVKWWCKDCKLLHKALYSVVLNPMDLWHIFSCCSYGSELRIRVDLVLLNSAFLKRPQKFAQSSLWFWQNKTK